MDYHVTLLLLVCFSWSFFVSSTHQLQSSQTQILLQVRKHLEYPKVLEIWIDHKIDFCTISPSPQVNLTCENNFVTELKIMGDYKVLKGSNFDDVFSNQTLSNAFSMDSFVTTLTRLNTLKSLSLVSLGIWGPLPEKIHRLSSLEVLNLSSNFLYGSIPVKLGRMVKLETLVLDDNFFNDTIPYFFDSLLNLSVLSLRNNEVVSHKVLDFSSLNGLSLLDLSENNLNSQLPILPKGLIMAFLNNNSFFGEVPKQYGQLGHLQHLDMSFNSLEGTVPGHLFSLPNISFLNIGSNLFSGSISNDVKCGEKLGFIDISNNKLRGGLPYCLSTGLENKVVKCDGNCLTVDFKHQYSEAYCLEAHKNVEKSKGRNLGLLIGIIGGVSVLVVFLAFAFLFMCRKCCYRGISEQHLLRKTGPENSATGFTSEILANGFISESAKSGTQDVPMCRSFTIEELKDATFNFDNSFFLGEGSHGKLYKGRLTSGTQIVIRCLPLSKKYSIRNFKLRLDLLAKLRHPHLVCLLGHCIDDSSANMVFLVYEYIQHGNFFAQLSENGAEKRLEWPERLTILIGIAKAVHFLHTGVISSFINNRLKTNNILLTDHCFAKLSDYGLSIVSEESETDKSWNMTNSEDDVYNFGFIILDSIVGPSVAAKRDPVLLNELASFDSHGSKRKLVDDVVITTSSRESLMVVISIMNKCISSDSSSRPSFEDILWNLQYAAQVQTSSNGDQK